MVLTHNLGFPRIGAKRELKMALESFWGGKSSEQDLLATAKAIRLANWQSQQAAGLDHVPVNDFTLYDQMLDMTATLGAVPARYNWSGGAVDLATYFAMARGNKDVTAMEMTKWFDTNYHYIVPEFEAGQNFALSSRKVVDEFLEAKQAGINGRPVLIGPVSYLLLGKMKQGDGSALSLLPKILPVYAQLLAELKAAGAEWIQLDEPMLALDLPAGAADAYRTAYASVRGSAAGLKLLLATYFEALADNTALACSLPVDALHIDLVRAPAQLPDVLQAIPSPMILSLGLVDGRNIWRANLQQALVLAKQAISALGTDRVWVGGSCSLIHSPVDLDFETKLDAELKGWMAFAKQKLGEIAALGIALNKGEAAAAEALAASEAAVTSRRNSTRIHKSEVKARVGAVTKQMLTRLNPFSTRRLLQQEVLRLPAFPTTTIGSFPQTELVRKARAEFKRGERDAASYDKFLKDETAACIKYQEEIGIDVLVHGEFERNDMVEYFGEQLEGYCFTQNGWVQSYGSRYVKPPIIFGDVSRPRPMTVEWSVYAQSLTSKPMKGMLTGPITILQWSFVRDDQPRSTTAQQIALAIRDEVTDLENAGIGVIQIDEPALREGLPLRRKDWDAYLRWAVDAFRLSSTGVADTTQIHTHMCYSEFNDIIHSIAELDADVISIETSRSQMELLDAFVQFKYPNEIGPGVYDIHSPRTPSETEMVQLMEKATRNLDAALLWVNPDCGLKTRKWDEVKPALERMVAAARSLRQKIKIAA